MTTYYAATSIKHNGEVVAQEGDAVDVSIFSEAELAVLVEGGTLTEELPESAMSDLDRARAIVKRLEAEEAEREASVKAAAKAEVESEERAAPRRGRGRFAAEEEAE